MLGSAREARVDTAQMYLPPEDITVSEGIARTLVTAGGAYKPQLTPYMSGPADMLDSRRYSTVVFLGPGRTGKTVTLIDGWIARNVRYAPGDMLVVQASQDLARYYSKIRISRMIESSPEVRARLSPRRQDDNTFDKVFRSGMVLSIGWPSGAQLSGRDFRYVAATEYDLAADDVDDEGSLYALASKRIETYLSAGKIVLESSVRREYRDANWRAPAGSPHMAPPATGITGLYNSGTRCWYYWRCPDCHEWIALNPDVHVMFGLPPMEQIVSDLADADPGEWARDFAVVGCRHCGGAIREQSKRALNVGGAWVPDGCSIRGAGEIQGEARETKIASFHISSVAAAYQSWAALLEKYAVAIQAYIRTGDEVDIKSTVNLDQGRAYLPLSVRRQRDNNALQARDESWPEQTVPEGVRFLTAQIDIQAGKTPRFVIQVHGVGVNRERWVIDRYALKSSARPTGEEKDGVPVMHPLDPASFTEDWDRLIDKVIDRRYPLADGSGRTMPIRMVVCDSGGKAGVTRRAYEFWRRLRTQGKHHRFRLVKGAERESVTAKTIDETYPDARNRVDRNSGAAGDVPVLIVNVTAIKDLVMADVWRDTPGPGYYHFPNWLPTSFFDEFDAEHRGDKRWERDGKRSNESIDLSVYGEVALIRLGADKINWLAPPPWAETWDRNPDVRADDAPPPAPVKRKLRTARSPYLDR
ncbi:MAG: terminase [Desulfurellales bacterium]|nr:MAG: terminase [Desulfurellales bacterium]